jgi:hypothetical protein
MRTGRSAVRRRWTKAGPARKQLRHGNRCIWWRTRKTPPHLFRDCRGLGVGQRDLPFKHTCQQKNVGERGRNRTFNLLIKSLRTTCFHRVSRFSKLQLNLLSAMSCGFLSPLSCTRVSILVTDRVTDWFPPALIRRVAQEPAKLIAIPGGPRRRYQGVRQVVGQHHVGKDAYPFPCTLQMRRPPPCRGPNWSLARESAQMRDVSCRPLSLLNRLPGLSVMSGSYN